VGRRAQLELNKHGAVQPVVWITSELMEHSAIRKLQLIVRAPAGTFAEAYLVTITEAFIGSVTDDGWDLHDTQIVSHSRWNQHQEIMLLMRPFGWLMCVRGTAMLVPTNRGFEWRISEWSAK
jgi:hypothetical protein